MSRKKGDNRLAPKTPTINSTSVIVSGLTMITCQSGRGGAASRGVSVVALSGFSTALMSWPSW